MQRFPSFHRNSSSTRIRTAKEHLLDILDRHHSATIVAAAATRREKQPIEPETQQASKDEHLHSEPKRATGKRKMPSSKGEPTDPDLREEVKEEVKAEEKGGGAGSWSAWKAGEMARRYEDRGGDYEDKGDNKNKAQKGAPEKK